MYYHYSNYLHYPIIHLHAYLPIFKIPQQSTKNKKLPTTTLVKQGWEGYLISPGDMYTDPVSGEPQFSCFQMVYCTGTSWWFPTISDVYQVWSLVQQKLSILPLEKFHFEIVLNGLTKLLNFTTVSRKFQTVLTIFWIFRRNSLSTQLGENSQWLRAGLFEKKFSFTITFWCSKLNFSLEIVPILSLILV